MHSSARSAAETLAGAVQIHPSVSQAEARPSARDSAASLSQQNPSTRQDTNVQLAFESECFPNATVGSDTRFEAAPQPSTDPHEWDSYVNYINHQVIQGYGDSSAADSGSQGMHPVQSSKRAPKSRGHAQRLAKSKSKQVQAELEVQLAQVEAAAGTLLIRDLCIPCSLFCLFGCGAHIQLTTILPFT